MIFLIYYNITQMAINLLIKLSLDHIYFSSPFKFYVFLFISNLDALSLKTDGAIRIRRRFRNFTNLLFIVRITAFATTLQCHIYFA